MDVLFLCKRDNFYADIAAEYAKQNFNAHVFKHRRGDKLHRDSLRNEYDYIISFLYPDVLGGDVLCRAVNGSINFHTGPPKYPGIGCTNQAIYNREKEYGVTCHYMKPKVDSGEIIAVYRFSMNNETVYTLTQKCYTYLLTQFYDIVDHILAGKELKTIKEHWQRKAYTRKELDELCKLNKDMSDEEIKLRVHATDYPNMPGANIKLGGINFEYRKKNV